MKALVCTGVGEASIEEIPKPAPGRGEVLVAVDRVQLSVTECELFKGVETSYSEAFRCRIEDGGARAFGHEFVGTVVETGDGPVPFETGDRVYAPGKVVCDDCSYCDRGYTHLCENVRIVGRHMPGAMAEYVALPTEPLRRLPEGVSDAEGAALQPAASALLSVHDADPGTGATVAVVGTGVMGYACGQFARCLGAGTVVAIDVDGRKLRLASDRGMVPVRADEADPVEEVEALTDGVGADVVFEAVGGEQTHLTRGSDPLAEAFRMVRPGGTVVQVGHVQGEPRVEPRTLRAKGVRWLNPLTNVVSTGPNADTGTLAADLVASERVSIAEYVTHELEGLESFEEAVEITLDKEAHDALGPAQMIVD